MNEEMLEVLKGIRDAINRNNLGSTVEVPGIVEGGFMRLHDKMDEIVWALDQHDDHLKTIAKALSLIAGEIDKRL
jgi:hypothetical protein